MVIKGTFFQQLQSQTMDTLKKQMESKAKDGYNYIVLNYLMESPLKGVLEKEGCRIESVKVGLEGRVVSKIFW